MGYYTNYSLIIYENNSDKSDEEIIKHLREYCPEAKWCLDEYGYCNNDGKWYDHQDDMQNFSKLYPDTLFLLEGNGENSDDIWKLYVKNGKSQLCTAKIVFDKFDESKLQ